jgi:hypothetical protein
MVSKVTVTLVKVKKVKLSLSLIKDVWGSEGIAPPFLTLTLD